jgi:hypothetical protein
MNVAPSTQKLFQAATLGGTLPNTPPLVQNSQAGEEGKAGQDGEELRVAFQSFVGQTLFGQMLKAMRKTQKQPAYFHGGQTEEIFRQQLDQVLAEKLSDASGDKLSGPMFDLFRMKRM